MTDSRKSYVYVLFRPTGVPCYVGKGVGNRWNVHEREGSHNQHLDRIIRAAGGELPKIKVREQLTDLEAREIEMALIGAIGRGKDGPLVNLTNGGEGFLGGRHTAESREKIGARTRGKRQRPAHTDKIRLALSGVKRKPLPDAVRAKISAALKSSAKSARHILALAESARGKSLSVEHRLKVAKANRGVKRSIEAKAAMRSAAKRRHANSVGKAKPWLAASMSRRTWYRRRAELERVKVA